MTPAEFQMINDSLNRLHDGHATIIDRLDHLDDCLDSAKDSIKSHIVATENRFDRLETMFRSAVPDGDFEGHRLYHMQVKRKWSWLENLKNSVLTEVLKFAAIGATGWLLITLWGGVKIAIVHPSVAVTQTAPTK